MLLPNSYTLQHCPPLLPPTQCLNLKSKLENSSLSIRNLESLSSLIAHLIHKLLKKDGCVLRHVDSIFLFKTCIHQRCHNCSSGFLNIKTFTGLTIITCSWANPEPAIMPVHWKQVFITHRGRSTKHNQRLQALRQEDNNSCTGWISSHSNSWNILQGDGFERKSAIEGKLQAAGYDSMWPPRHRQTEQTDSNSNLNPDH